MADTPWLDDRASPWYTRRPGVFTLLCGVVLPLTTIGVELATRMCSQALFDPLPTLFHVALVVLVPLANLALYFPRLKRSATHVRWLSLANGGAVGIALIYTMLFLPILPIGAIAVVYWGIGLLPLTPLIALLAAIRCRIHLAHLARSLPPR